MVYYPRNSNHRFIEREPRRRVYYSQQQSCRGFEEHHHAPSSAKPTSWNDYRGDYNGHRRNDYDHFPGDYDGYRRNNFSLPLNHRFRRNLPNVAPKPLIRRSNWTVQSYKHYQYSSSKFHRPNYGVARDQKERRFQIPPRRYNLKPTSLPREYAKFNGNREGKSYHGHKMQQHQIRMKAYNNQIRNRRFAAAANKPHSPELPPPPPLPESEFTEDQSYSPAPSSPSYSEDEEGELRSCSPVLMCSPDNTFC